MADTMNFGPEWLRTLSTGGGNTTAGGGVTTSSIAGAPVPQKLATPTTPSASLGKKFTLAEYRYGREELLQLFSEELSLPTDMVDLPPVTRKQQLVPLAFMPLSSEEQLALSGGVNSGTVYGMRSGRGGFYPNRGGRGGGRGRGRGDPPFHRSGSYDEFYPPPWSAESRGGGYTPTGRGGSRALKDGNWRSPTTPDTEEPKPPPPSWSNHWHPPQSPGTTPTDRGGTTGTGSGGAWKDGGRNRWQMLPEWAGDDGANSTAVGSFDSSGTFTSPDKEARSNSKPSGDVGSQQGRRRTPSESEQQPFSETTQANSQETRTQTQTSGSVSTPTSGRPRVPVIDPNMKEPVLQLPMTTSGEPSPSVREEFKRLVLESIDESEGGGGEFQDGFSVQHPSAAVPNHAVTKPSLVHIPLVGSVGRGRGGEGLLTTTPPAHTSSSMLSDSINSAVVMSSMHMAESTSLSREPDDSVFSTDTVEDDHMQHIQKATEALLSTEEEETPNPSPTTPSQPPHPHTLPIPPSPVAPPTTTSAPSLPLVNPEDLNRWIYKDPQGEVQGPFSSLDMKDWFDAGYFTMDLMVQRVCDVMMLPLGQVIRIWGCVPFTPPGQPHPPPVRPNEPFWQRLFQQQQEQQLLLQQQKLIMQQPPAKQSSSSLPTSLPLSKAEQRPGRPAKKSAGPMSPGQGPQQTATPSTAAQAIWTSSTPREEDQWPDITGEGVWDSSSKLPPVQPSQADREKEAAERRRREKEEEETARVRAAKEEQERKLTKEREAEIQRQLEEQKRREEERRRAEDEKRRREDAKRKEAEAMRVRQEAEKVRQAAEEARKRALQEEEARRKEQERQRQLEEEALQKLKDHERRRKAAEAEEEERKRRQQLAAAVWTGTVSPGRSSSGHAPSLLQIQQEEAVYQQRQRDEFAKAHVQQSRLVQQQQQQQQLSGWSSTARASGPPKPKSFLEIQQEQAVDFPIAREPAIVAPQTRGSQKSKGSSWSTIASSKQQPPLPSWAAITPSPTSSAPTPYLQSKSEPLSSSLVDSIEDEDEELSFWDECSRVAKKTPVPSRLSSSIPPPSQSGGAQKKRGSSSKEEASVRRLLSANSASDDFNRWCEQELRKFNTDVDAATFVSFLLEVESIYEVHDYVKSYLGETKEAHEFAKQFLERRQKFKPSQQATQPKKTRSRDRSGSQSGSEHSDSKSSTSGGGGGGAGRGDGGEWEGTGGSRLSKKKKKKMQKVNPAALLGFTVNAAERPNMGEIQSVHDA